MATRLKSLETPDLVHESALIKGVLITISSLQELKNPTSQQYNARPRTAGPLVTLNFRLPWPAESAGL